MTTIAVVGAGPWGREIIGALCAIDVNVIVAARSIANQEQAHQLGAIQVVGSPEDLAAYDGVVVATSTSSHQEMIRRVHERGTPIFCEKPLTASRESAEALKNLCGPQIFVMDKWRYNAPVLELARIARTGEFGPVIGLDLVRESDSIGHDDVDVEWALLPHDIAISREVFGTYPSLQHAIGSVIDGRIATVSAHLSHSDAGRATWIRMTSSSVAPARLRRITMICERAVVQLAQGTDEFLTIYPSTYERDIDTAISTRACPGESSLIAELRAFVDYTKGGVPPKSNIDDAVSNVTLIEQIRKSILS